MAPLRDTVVVCMLVALALGVGAVIEKTREDLEQRRHVFSRNRTETRHHPDEKHHMDSTSSSSSLSSSRRRVNASSASSVGSSTSHGIHHGSPIKDPLGWNNRNRGHRPYHYGSVQIGPGLNFQVSGDMNWDFGSDGRWWRGPNVCFRNETKEEETKNVRNARGGDDLWRVMPHRLMVSHVCDDTGSAYKCTTVRGMNGKVTTSVKIYECCPGYERREDEPGCTKSIEMTDLMSTLERLNATEMVKALKMSGLARLLNRENYTVFAPVNEAFEKYNTEETNSNVVKITPELVNMAKDLDDAIVGHVVKGFVRTTDVEDEQLINTELHSADIRINKYNIHSKNMMTANCVPMLVKDVPATDGIVHLVQDVLPTVTQSLDQLVSRNLQLTQLRQVLKTLQLNDQGQYTLFAPTNSAFEKLKPSLKEKIQSGHRCGIEILKQHLLPNVICSAVTQNRAVTKNVLDHRLTLSRSSGKLFVEEAEVVQPDVMGTNGVMHIIDQVLIPDDAGDILDAAERTGTSDFLQLIESAGLTKKLHNMNNFTMFLPTNDAIKALPPDVMNSLSKKVDELERLVNFHIVPRRIKYRNLANDNQLPTLDGKNDIRVKSYYSFPFSRHSIKTVQCAPIIQADVNSCGDSIHVISKVLLPPSGDVLHVLENDQNFSKLVTLVRKFHLEEMLRQDSAFTFFAPSNKAFESLSAQALEKLQNDPEKLTKILKSHMIADVLCCAGIFQNAYPFSSREVNLDGWIVAVENNGRISYGHVPVTSCDKTATNGVVHSIDSFVPAALSRYDIVRAVSPWRQVFTRWNFDDFFDYLDMDR